MTIENKIAGALAGMVLGDALGVPGELWPREKVRERFGFIDTFLDGPEDNIVACYFKAGHYTDDSAQVNFGPAKRCVNALALSTLS